MKRTYLISAIIALFVTMSTIATWQFAFRSGKTVKIEHINSPASHGVAYTIDEKGNYMPLDFTEVSERVVDAVVNIKSMQTIDGPAQSYQYRQLPDPFKDFFGDDFFNRFFHPQNPDQEQPENKDGESKQFRMGTGSGVIINESGYIVTNNHVIQNADDIEVTLSDNRTYKASVVGVDPSTDLALIQIKEKDLPTLAFVNSNDVKVGEWVLAVGNPFSLNSTVTAGIVSAKARNINILKEKFAVESFIQTDAAINPGNSGGALVNLEGGLIGINTAIASPTGSYSGYGFAVPSNIVNKVVEDILTYGAVQRAVLGVMVRTVDGNLAKEKDLSIHEGTYVNELLENSAAEKAGIKVGDVILNVDGMKVISTPTLQEIIAQHHPGDQVKVKVNREGKELNFNVTLNNSVGNTVSTIKEHRELLSVLGIEISTLGKDEAEKLDVSSGVRVTDIFAGKIRRETQMHKGFIITHVNGKAVKDSDAFAKALDGSRGGVMLEGIYEDLPGRYYYAFGLDL